MRPKAEVKMRLNIPTPAELKVQLSSGREVTIPAREEEVPSAIEGLALSLEEAEELKGLINRGAVSIVWS
ncbi:hypothetical protein [Archangium violaceum]|uniref:Uncharacterized protein n=1 Tax=Archangium violaceum Cb vi76 TaxID=1406225 RepID=A0A084SR87_9BACT|nr:hypothetical protein [Archangium violaceum]KFA90972.1 hypothetical protein Q664_24945 [Archangium violaceum Cb vi76]